MVSSHYLDFLTVRFECIFGGYTAETTFTFTYFITTEGSYSEPQHTKKHPSFLPTGLDPALCKMRPLGTFRIWKESH